MEAGDCEAAARVECPSKIESASATMAAAGISLPGGVPDQQQLMAVLPSRRCRLERRLSCRTAKYEEWMKERQRQMPAAERDKAKQDRTSLS